MPGINVSKLKSLMVLLPPIKEQTKFSSRLESLYRFLTSLRMSLAELDQLFASLQHRAFRGEL